MKKRVLHQFLVDVSTGDATSDHAFLIRNWLRELGFESDIYSPEYAEELSSEVRRFTPGALAGQDLVIYHHTIGSASLNHLTNRRIPLLLIYHNITPPKYFMSTDPVLARQLINGREQLREILPLTRLALGASGYSEEELRQIGYENTGVLPIVLNEAAYDIPPDIPLQSKMRNGRPTLLFVGRVAPNKRQEDLVKLLYYVRQILPRAHLILVGSLKAKGYVRWLQDFVDKNGLTDAVTFTGHVTQQEMVTYYKSADLFVSMSEHEGFGKPLIESMYLGLPVLAYSATAVPFTMGDAGVLFSRKEYEPLSEMVRILYENHDIRQRLINTQALHAHNFMESNVRKQFKAYLDQLNCFD